ncbi:MAG TPA: aldehyde dehydrogenase family protein [Coxiellaceae bacterium]|nr:MAG: aldehyde dehydrogenase [Gammaproteobacteria bacterium RIFCSPHIGHO2_12_FULL_36_30]HLB56385.1 aldehyde dehydrogenase family protein [Coxiellaceae bacterium]
MRKLSVKEIFKQLNLTDKTNSGHCAGGKWIASKNMKTIDSFNPATKERLASVAVCSAKECQQTIHAAHKAFLSWRTVPAPKRGELIRQIGNELRAQKKELAALITLEMGKIYQEALGEVQEMIDMADFSVGQSRMLYGLSMHSERPQHKMIEQWHPLGVVGVISAFNFPVAVWAWNAFLAVIAGNTVVWKPSSKTPLCAIAVQHICNKVMKENNMPGIFSLTFFHDKNAANAFLDTPLLPLISFTGSTNVGRHVGERVAKRIGRSLLEMGGNNAIIVDESADLSLVVPAILFSAVGTAGQRCTTVRRVIIHHNIYDTVIKKLIHAYNQIKIGNPLDAKTVMGPLVDQSAVDAYLSAIKKAKFAGGKILVGGKTLEKSGYFVTPTIIAAENKWNIVQEETFAPILYAMKYKNFSDAIKMQNESEYGLSSSFFTNDLKRSEQFLSAIGSDCGIANINIGTSGAEIGGAFGGEKNTGGGREAGSDAWKTYMRRQTNTINWGDDLPLAQGIKF